MPREGELGLVAGEAHLDRGVLVLEQALQLEHGLARQDHFLLGHSTSSVAWASARRWPSVATT
jgi:hypothetical protein